MGMTWSWSTFVIEIVNFVILVWLLQRFLYRPVTRAISARQKAIHDEVQRAQDLKGQSEALAAQYESRLEDWQAQKTELKASFESELAAERGKREAQLQADLQREREQSEIAARARDAEERSKLRRQAAAEAAEFCAHLLARFASPELEKQIVDASVADMGALSDEERSMLARSFDGRDEALVLTRYPLGEERRAAVARALAQLLGRVPKVRFEEREDLVAGMRVDLGTATMEADLAGELRWFAR